MSTTRRPTAAQRERYAVANAALVRRVVEEACNRGEMAVFEEMLASSTPPDPIAQRGQRSDAAPGPPVRLREMVAGFRAAVPDAHWTILEQVAQDATVVTRLAVRGNFSGPLVRLAPPGRPATLTGVVIGRFEAGCLVDLWLQADLLGLLQQLGVMPPLDLAQAATMAQVHKVGVLLEDDPSPASPRSPPYRRVCGSGRTSTTPPALPHQYRRRKCRRRQPGRRRRPIGRGRR